MGIIVTSTTNRDGIEHSTRVRTNKIEDFLLNAIGYFSNDLEWRAVHFVEKRKLKK